LFVQKFTYPVMGLEGGIHGQSVAQHTGAPNLAGEGRILHRRTTLANLVRVRGIGELLEEPVRRFGAIPFSETLAQGLQGAS